VGTDYRVYARVKARRVFHRVQGCLVVGVDSHENVVGGIADGREVMFQHLPDDAVFAPQRDQDGDAALGCGCQVRIRRPGKGLASGKEENQADKQVVQPADENPERERNETHHPIVVKPHGVA
jgi:hypothetical protein